MNTQTLKSGFVRDVPAFDGRGARNSPRPFCDRRLQEAPLHRRRRAGQAIHHDKMIHALHFIHLFKPPLPYSHAESNFIIFRSYLHLANRPMGRPSDLQICQKSTTNLKISSMRHSADLASVITQTGKVALSLPTAWWRLRNEALTRNRGVPAGIAVKPSFFPKFEYPVYL